MSYATQDTAANDPVFQQQVRQAALQYAATVAGESSGTTNHTARSTTATQVARNGLFGDQLLTWARAVASDGATAPGASDATILTRITAIWNLMAGGL